MLVNQTMTFHHDISPTTTLVVFVARPTALWLTDVMKKTRCMANQCGIVQKLKQSKELCDTCICSCVMTTPFVRALHYLHLLTLLV